MKLDIDIDRCVKCKLCEKVCPSGSICIDKLSVDSKSCIQCAHCVAVCPKQAIKVDGKFTKPVDSELNDIETLLSGIRSTRSFKDKAVEPELLDRLISILGSAPSAMNGRAIELEVYTNKAKIKMINDSVAESLYKLFSKLTSPMIKPIVTLLKGKEMINKLANYRDKMKTLRVEAPNFICYEAPVVIILHGPNDGGMHCDDSNIWLTYLTIAAKSMGLSSCINGFIVTALQKDKKLKDTLSIPKGRKVYGSLLLGYGDIKYINHHLRAAPKVKFHN